MPKSNLLFIILLFLFSIVRAQSPFSKELKGVITSKSGDVAATHVQNKTSKKATITDVNGYFNIRAAVQDTIIISAVQFKKKEIIVTTAMLQSKILQIPLEEALTELDEVVVMPYNLSGDISKDLGTLKTEQVVTASTLGLPNAYVKPITKAERDVFEATALPLNKIINGITGYSKMLKNRVKRNEKYERTQRVRAFYVDSLFISDLRIPLQKIDDFMYFCEIDTVFQSTVDSHDHLKIWAFLERKSKVYRKNNELK